MTVRRAEILVRAATQLEHREVVIVGAGGLGTPAAVALLRLWPERKLHLKIIDFDTVERSNLNRQFLFQESDQGSKKAETLAKRLSTLPYASHTSEIQISPIVERLEESNALRLLGDADYVIDGTDSVKAKLMINDLCVSRGIPFTYGGVLGERGQLLSVEPGKSGCLRCLYGEFGDTSKEEITCQNGGVLGAVVGAIGFLQAGEALSALFPKLASKTLSAPDLSATDSSLCEPRHLLYALERGENAFQERHIPPAKECPLGCSGVKTQLLDIREKRCPETFLFTKVALEYLPKGGRLEVVLGNEESATTVWRSLKEQGFFTTRKPVPTHGGAWRIVSRNLRETEPFLGGSL